MVTAITPVTFPTLTPQVDGKQESQKLLIVENERLVREDCREGGFLARF